MLLVKHLPTVKHVLMLLIANTWHASAYGTVLHGVSTKCPGNRTQSLGTHKHHMKCSRFIPISMNGDASAFALNVMMCHKFTKFKVH